MGREFAADPQHAFPGQGQMKPEQLEIERLRKEVAKLKAERDILKKAAAYFAKEVDMRFGFIAKHRGIWPVAWLCAALGVSRSGFHAWLDRAAERAIPHDEVLGAKVRRSFLASDRTYGARRVWHDVLAEGISCGLHRIERLMRAQALRARPRRRGRPKDPGERRTPPSRRTCSTAPSRPARRTANGSPTSPTSGRRKAGCMWPRSRPVLPPGRRLVDEARA